MTDYDGQDQAYANLLEEVERTHSEIERLNKMFCVGCGACGTETEYAECTCEGGEE